jgi:hypothetical protein
MTLDQAKSIWETVYDPLLSHNFTQIRRVTIFGLLPIDSESRIIMAF